MARSRNPLLAVAAAAVVTHDPPADETVRGGDPGAARLLDVNDDLWRYARYGVLAMFLLVALVAAVNLYTSVSATIDL